MAVEIFEEVFGSIHPDVATALSNKAQVLEAQVRRQINVHIGYRVAHTLVSTTLQCVPRVTQRERGKTSWGGWQPLVSSSLVLF